MFKMFIIFKALFFSCHALMASQWTAVGEFHTNWEVAVLRNLISHSPKKPRQCLILEVDFDDYEKHFNACNENPKNCSILQKLPRLAPGIAAAYENGWRVHAVDEYGSGKCQLGAPENETFRKWSNCRNNYMLEKSLNLIHGGQCETGIFFVGRWHISDRFSFPSETLVGLLEAHRIGAIFKLGLFHHEELKGKERKASLAEFSSFDRVYIHRN